jgi:hypothetical protein
LALAFGDTQHVHATPQAPDEALESRARYAAEFGAVGNGRQDDTAAIQAGIDWAVANRSVLLFDPGWYAIDSLDLAGQAALRSVAAGGSRFASGGTQLTTAFVPKPGRTTDDPMLVISGTGARLEGIGVHGVLSGTPDDQFDDPANWISTPGIVVRGGVEVVLRDVRVFRVANVGIKISELNNARWSDVFVDNCGTKDIPAMRIESLTCSNFLVFEGLTIERSANVALDLATGDDPVRDWISNVVFIGLHVESNQDSANGGHQLNTSPLIDIGNVRAVTFIAPQILGNPSPVLRYNQRISVKPNVPGVPGGDARDQQGGVHVLGGWIKQHGGGAAEHRVASVQVAGNGRGFAAFGVKFDALWCPGVIVDDTYSYDAVVFGSLFRQANDQVPNPAPVVDGRPRATQRNAYNTVHGGQRLSGGDLELDGGSLSLRGGGLSMVVSSPRSKTTVEPTDAFFAGWVGAGRGHGTDHAGRFWMRPKADDSGEAVTVRFAEARQHAPLVVLSPRNAVAARSGAWSESVLDSNGTCTGFAVHASEVMRNSQGVGQYDYLVVDQQLP